VYPAQLVLQDVRSIHGSQFKDAALIVGSSPCQEFSYRAMPWKRAKALPPPYLGMELFNAQFRIQREASEAAGRHIPMVVENVRGAQKWVGRARWHFGSFYLWGDVPALMPIAKAAPKVGGITFSGYGTPGYKGAAFNGTAERRLREGTKNSGGSRFAIGSPGQKEVGRNPVHEAVKGGDGGWSNDNKRSGKAATTGYLSRSGSKSKARKAASAAIAKIPFVLAQHIARVYKPRMERAA
jgi:hypothetical protein